MAAFCVGVDRHVLFGTREGSTFCDRADELAESRGIEGVTESEERGKAGEKSRRQMG